MARFGDTLTKFGFYAHCHEYGERLSKRRWSQILTPLTALQTLNLAVEEKLGNLDTHSLPLAHTVRNLSIHCWGDDDTINGEHLTNLLRSFTSLDQLSLWGTFDKALPDALPQTLRKLNVADWQAAGSLNILRRLADPRWLPRLSETPILCVREGSDGYAYGQLLDADLLPSQHATHRIVEAALASMQTRQIWRQDDPGEDSWAVLVEDIQLFWSRVSASDDSDWSDESVTEL